MFELSEKLFHSFDIRIDSTFFTKQVSEKLAHAEAYYFINDLKLNSILLCRDARLMGAEILEYYAELFSSFGFTVYITPSPVSTCLFYYSAMMHPDCVGIMIGASHNPKRYTGQKIVGPYCSPTSKTQEQKGVLDIIQSYFDSGKRVEEKSGGKIIFVDYKNDYINDSFSYLDFSPSECKKLSLVLDFLSGSASNEIPYALKKLPLDIKYFNFIPNGKFPSGDPNPIIMSSTGKSRKMLETGQYEFALCFDGDGDRLDILDKSGLEIPPSIIFAFILPFLDVAKRKDSVVCLDPKASPVINSYIAQMGYDTYLVPNGHSKIKTVLKRNSENFILAVEESGHYYINWEKEGRIYSIENILLIVLSFLKALTYDPKRLSELMKLQQNFFREREWGFFFKDAVSREKALWEIKKAFEKEGFRIQEKQKNGDDLESTLIKLGLEDNYTRGSILPDKWVQIAQRASESELYLGRWEILSSDKDLVISAKAMIEKKLSMYEGKYYIG